VGRKTYFFPFTLDLLGGEPVWQVPHGLPFANLGVACALDIVSEFIASVRKNIITVPITIVAIPVADIDKLLEHSVLTTWGKQERRP
jgi:hypothetical protein